MTRAPQSRRAGLIRAVVQPWRTSVSCWTGLLLVQSAWMRARVLVTCTHTAPAAGSQGLGLSLARPNGLFYRWLTPGAITRVISTDAFTDRQQPGPWMPDSNSPKGSGRLALTKAARAKV